MERFPMLESLREAVHGLLSEEDANNNALSTASVAYVCSAIEACLQHGLKRISSKETVSLWGLIQWTNIAQQKRFHGWKEQQEKLHVQEQSQGWYNDMFKEELQNISSLGNDNQKGEAMEGFENPLTLGFNASIRTVNSLLHVKTPKGKVRAWIRHCCNTHILSSCLAGLMHPLNRAALESYFTPNALCCNEDAREIFVGLTSTLDRLQFGFVVDNPELDEPRLKPQKSKPDVAIVAKPVERPAEERAVLRVLDSKAQLLHELLKNTPQSILSPRALEEITNSSPNQRKFQLFGVPFASLLVNPMACDIALLDPTLGVPNFIEGCFRLIDTAATIATPGLFRSHVNKTRFIQLIHQVESIGTLSMWSSVHHGIILLIKFFRDLPEALFPQHLYTHLLEILCIDGRLNQIMVFRQLVQQLHWSVKPALVRLCTTLTRLVRLANDVDTELLSSVFASVLFPLKSPASEKDKRVEILQLLFENAEAILVDIIEDLNERQQSLQFKLQRLAQIATDRQVSINSVASLPQYKDPWQKFQLMFSIENAEIALRGGGLLVVKCLTQFVQEHQEIALQIIAQRSVQDSKQYPLPSVSVYIVRMLNEILGLEPPSPEVYVDIDTAAWLKRCDNAEETSVCIPLPTLAAKSIARHELWPFKFISAPHLTKSIGYLTKRMPFIDSLAWLYFYLIGIGLVQASASCMDFNTILTETRCQLQTLLNEHPASITELWQNWSEHISQQYLLPAKSAQALAHMRKYVVVWKGGVTIRGTPSTQGEVLGTRERGECIETVLKAGEWLKIRDVPGVQDSGWVLRRTATATLLELVS
ncbi:hypothetical protein THRCLA_08977 [Thraustotheca clavata]|uniref:SH3 domain-containing protein n=1 Tax=Thraustotheca clavata TaxID=74557 RepID=A0A1V9Z0P3_9STRA|nr:hypothetical protein THRCLA_08977 [Thraustotheca clavata]